MNKLSKIKFAIIGCGRISEKYAQVFKENSLNGEIVAACDLQLDRAQLFASKFNIPSYCDMHKMVQENLNTIDALIILTPSGDHASHVVALAKYGKHIIVEKPMALTLSDADKMINECDQRGIKLFVVKQNRYNLPVQKLRETFESGRFGKIVMGTVRVRWCRDQNYYNQDPWRGTWAHDGGVFTNQASHHVDLLEWFLGEPISVFAKARTALVNIEAEDTGVAIVTFRSGAIGVIEATTAARPKDMEGSLSILGEKGMVEIGGCAVNKIKTWSFIDSLPEDHEALNKFQENPPNVYGFGHIRYLEHVIDCLHNSSPSLVDGLEGRKSLELISAIYESIETGQEVGLKFQPKLCRLGIV